MVFVDTSAILAVLDADDTNHKSATEVWKSLLNGENRLVTSNYVLVETFAVVQRRLGVKASRTTHTDILPIFHIEWITQNMHESGVTAFFVASRKRLSLVDCVSFYVMRELGIDTAFVFDRNFKEQGFRCLP